MRDFRLTEGRAILQVRADRRKTKPWGMEGGSAGTEAWTYINLQDGFEPLPSKVTTELTKGEVFRHTPGGAIKLVSKRPDFDDLTFKGDFFDRLVQLSLAGFWNSYDNLQIHISADAGHVVCQLG